MIEGDRPVPLVLPDWAKAVMLAVAGPLISLVLSYVASDSASYHRVAEIILLILGGVGFGAALGGYIVAYHARQRAMRAQSTRIAAPV